MSPDQLALGERRARIQYLTFEEGGRREAPASGVRSQVELGELQASCIVESATGSDKIPLGEEVLVTIRLLFADEVGALFAGLATFELFEGNKRVARGSFIAEG